MAPYSGLFNRSPAAWVERLRDTIKVNSVALKEARDGFERSRIVEALKTAHWISERDGDRYTKKTRTPAGLKNLYHIREQGGG